MPIEISRDDDARRVIAVASGEFQADDFAKILAQLRSSGTWTYGVLLDVRRMTGTPAIAELRPIMNLTRTNENQEGPRGPVAIVAGGSVIYGMACAYAAMSEPKGRVEVFPDRPEAERWLDARQPR